jgi:anti-sigma B factor antagonist
MRRSRGAARLEGTMTDAPVLAHAVDARPQFSVTPGTGPRTLRLAGELDIAVADRLRAAFHELDGHGDLVLELSELTFMDSSGIHACAGIATELAQTGARLVLDDPRPMVQRVVEIAGLLHVANIVER